MCGIAGIFHYRDRDRRVDRAVLTQMTRVLAHRGPDGEGIHIEPGLGLGHRRLAIVDLSPTGRQPMATDDGMGWITYNGELYNHQMFRSQLSGRGEPFRGSSDTETLLRLMAIRGPDALSEAAGIFAFAYWDRGTRTLTLARDPMGVKQLYTYDDGSTLIFASEIKSVLVHPSVPRAIDPVAVSEYLHFHTPLFERTFLTDIRQLRAGEYLQVSAQRTRRHTYWRVTDFSQREGSSADQVRALRDEIATVVRDQLMSDVPVGSFFSGGIDSTAVAAFASRAGTRPRCFGVHFTGQGVIDERPFQEASARSLGLELDLITLDGSTFPEDLLTLMYYQDQPVVGAAMLPMHAVARLASRSVKVCLGGQAADEVFGGYARYALVHPLRVAQSWLRGRFMPGGVSPEASQTTRSARVGGNLWAQFRERRTLSRVFALLRSSAETFGDWRERYFTNFARVPEAVWQGVFASPDLVARGDRREQFLDVLAASPATDPADKVMHWDLQTYLTGLFQQDDRMSMANSLESRVPFADPRLVRFAFHTGFDFKFREGASKWILRESVSDVVPAEVLNRRKVGFDTPAEAWMKGRHASFVRDLLTSSSARQRGLWNARGLTQILDCTEHPLWFDVIWKALCIESWATIVLDQQVPPGVAIPAEPPTDLYGAGGGPRVEVQ